MYRVKADYQGWAAVRLLLARDCYSANNTVCYTRGPMAFPSLLQVIPRTHTRSRWSLRLKRTKEKQLTVKRQTELGGPLCSPLPSCTHPALGLFTGCITLSLCSLSCSVSLFLSSSVSLCFSLSLTRACVCVYVFTCDIAYVEVTGQPQVSAATFYLA